MDRLRELGSGVLITLGLLIGGGGGWFLGLTTERGFVGIITVVSALVGAGAGVYIAQLIISGGGDEEP